MSTVKLFVDLKPTLTSLDVAFRHRVQVCNIFDLSWCASALTFWASAGHTDKHCHYCIVRKRTFLALEEGERPRGNVLESDAGGQGRLR